MKIKQYKEYINEIMLHAEAQASQYQQKVQFPQIGRILAFLSVWNCE